MAFPAGFEASARGRCKVCGDQIAPNRYYCDEHRPAQKTKSAGEPKAPKAPTAVSVASTLVHEGEPSGAARSRPPTAKEWTDRLALALAFVTIYLVARIVARSDLPEADHETAQERLEMGDDEVEAIVEPIVAAITGPGHKLNKRYGRGALELLGTLPAGIAIVTWRTRVREFERQHCPPKTRRNLNASRGSGARPEAPGPQGPHLFNGQPAEYDPEVGLVTHPQSP